MLKYKINRRFGKSDSVRIPCTSYSETDYDLIDDTKRLMTCYLDEYFDLYPGETVRCILKVRHSYDGGVDYETGSVKDYIVDGVNYERMIFTVVADKYRRLYASDATITVIPLYIDDDGKEQVFNLMDFEVVTTDEKGQLSDEWIPFPEYVKQKEEIIP